MSTALPIANYALPIDWQGKGPETNLPARQWAMRNWQWAMNYRVSSYQIDDGYYWRYWQRVTSSAVPLRFPPVPENVTLFAETARFSLLQLSPIDATARS